METNTNLLSCHNCNPVPIFNGVTDSDWTCVFSIISKTNIQISCVATYS